ncbi:MAG TPA: hypothetical protein VI546_02750 [candidate division Zixibacteria bacterium]|nr:hypothetical protein [candidate division Zixibacteria bacterium]
MTASRGRFLLVLTFLLVATAGFILAEENQPKQSGKTQNVLPDLKLVEGLKATPGCLGVETAKTASGKQVIFAWFENKKACMKWYYRETHGRAGKTFFPNRSGQPRKPLEGVPDDVGPFMAIASLTPGEPGSSGVTDRPVSQMSIELYQPLKGRVFFGGTFSLATLKVPGIGDNPSKEK